MGGVNWTWMITAVLPTVLVVLFTISFILMTIYDVCAWIFRAIRRWLWEWRLHN